MARICVFDVNETLLDLKALDTHFERIFGKAAVREEWFNQLLQSAFVSTVLNTYIDFGKIGMAALEMVAEKQNVRLSDGDKEIVKNGMQQLPPHPEVKESLAQLRKAGLRLAALTNGYRTAFEACLGAVSDGGKAVWGECGRGAADSGSCLGCGGCDACWLCRSIRCTSREGAESASTPARCGWLRSA